MASAKLNAHPRPILDPTQKKVAISARATRAKTVTNLTRTTVPDGRNRVGCLGGRDWREKVQMTTRQVT